MDFQNNPYDQKPEPEQSNMPGNYPNGVPSGMPVYVRSVPQPENNMSTASMILGIISAGAFVMFMIFPFLSFVFAGISIVLALLSRGSSRRFSSHAKVGLITSGFSIGITLLTIIAFFFLIFTSQDLIEHINQSDGSNYEEFYDDFLWEY